MLKKFGRFFGLMAVLGLSACVAKGKYVKLKNELSQTQGQLTQTKDDLDKTKKSLAELAGLFLGRIGAEDNVLGRHSERPEKAHPELVGVPDIEDLGDSDPEFRTVLTLGRRCDGRLLCEPGRQRWETHLWFSQFRP